jgi:phosphotransferase system IIB component
MVILLTVAETWILYIGIILATIILIGAILFFTCGLRSKRENKISHVIVDEKFILDLLNGLGNDSNIKEVGIDNGRLKFKVSDLDLLNTETLKSLSTSGVFITGNNVKLLFKYDSKVILDELVKRGVAK